MYIDAKIEVREPSNTLVHFVQENFGLRKGERDAIALALELKTKFILTDDLKAINVCKLLGLRFITAIGMLTALYNKKIVEKNKAKEHFEKLKEISWNSKKQLDEFENTMDDKKRRRKFVKHYFVTFPHKPFSSQQRFSECFQIH